MVRNTLLPAVLAAFLAFPAVAQEDLYDPLKRNVEAFTGMLEQALELDGGLFGLGGERIDSMYLAGHGLVLEVRSNLANARSQLNLVVLNNSVLALRQGDNPFAMLARQSEDEAEDAVDTAISQAGEYARILRDADGVDDDSFEQLRVEIESLRQENRDGVERLRELTEELSASALEQGERFEQALSELTAEMGQLRERAEEMADELREQSESAQLERAERWQQDVASLELRLTGAMCEYGASLRELPSNENVTVILNGLGDESSGGGRADLVHTFSKSDLLACAEGDIDPALLGERSGRYSY
ncbi:MAG: hypothetical protein F4030_02610 [Gammaproteobacteria bacterium]|nr:hypothetical protein [Gammaproteobacteria bacterium]MYH85330.1 hypothetical protein [Gammaproteobacteria bacterium]MYK03866.1 hypothetical protein [Gammaproteobacteria bacterium]